MTSEESANPDTQPVPAGNRWFWPATIGLALVAGGVGFVVAQPSSDPVMSAIDPSVQTLPDPGPIDTLDLDGFPIGDEPVTPLEEPPAVSAPPTAATTIPPVTSPAVTAPPVTAPPVTAPPVTAPPSTAPPVAFEGLACTSAAGWSLVYPTEWYTGEGEFACTAFAPDPIVVAPNTEVDAAVFVHTLDEQFDVVIERGLHEGAALLERGDTNNGARTVTSLLYE